MDGSIGGAQAELAPHPFLTGIHTPLRDELTISELKVTGVLPKALSGSYLRNGPNPIAPDPANYHWFTGDGMLHAVRVENGKALWYRNRWIRSNAVSKTLGQPAAPGPRRGRSDNVNTSVMRLGEKAFALVEAGGLPVAISETLDEQNYFDFNGELDGPFSAHFHVDPANGEAHAICYEATTPNEVRHVVVDKNGRIVRKMPIAVKDGPSIHDCALSERYIVVLDLPVTFSMQAAMAGRPFPYRWNPEHPARVGLLPRHGVASDIIWCDVKSSYVFHTLNAFDLPDGKVAIDVCAYDKVFENNPQGPDHPQRGLERWIADPVTKSVEVKVLDPSPQEFPRLDERYLGRPYRFGFCVAFPGTSGGQDDAALGLYMHDFLKGTREFREFGPQRHPGEFVFVPETPDAPEGHGWLVGIVIDAKQRTSELVVLDARDFRGQLIATVHLPHLIPPGFHGNWFASAAAA